MPTPTSLNIIARMKLIDTHCHLTDKRLGPELDNVLARADEAGVVAVICATARIIDSVIATEIARQFTQVYCTAGVHPHDAKNAGEDYLERLEELAAHSKNVAVGEIGLDYHYDFSPRDVQRRVFAEQLALADRLGKPVAVHTREAFEETLSVISESGIAGEQILFHSFTGGPAEARRVLDIGAFISYSGIATFKNADAIRAGAALAGDDRIIIETDAPYLSPEPVRKMKINEPANVVHVAECLAIVRRTTPKTLAEQTTANAIRFFALDTTV